MNELESILNYLETTSLEPHDDYTSEFTYKEQKMLWNYIKQLKEQLEASEKARKEAIELVKDSSLEINTREYGNLTVVNSDDILDILDIDKGE